MRIEFGGRNPDLKNIILNFSLSFSLHIVPARKGLRRFLNKIIIFCLFLTACEFKEEAAKIEVSPFSQNDIEYRLISLESPNAYALEVKWPKTDAAVFLKKETSYRFNYEGGSRAEVILEKRNTQNSLIGTLIRISLDIPRDWEISSAETLTEDRKISCGRLYLNSGGILQLKNFKLDLSCNELIANSGSVETFSHDAVAIEKGALGLSGSESLLKFKRARGVLYLNLRGENGALGRNGLHEFDTMTGYFPGCRGQDGGVGGDSGSVTVVVQGQSNLEIAGVNVPGKGGVPGKMIAEFEDSEAILPVKPGEAIVFAKCILGGGSGVPGKEGAKGKACLQINNEQKCL